MFKINYWMKCTLRVVSVKTLDLILHNKFVILGKIPKHYNFINFKVSLYFIQIMGLCLCGIRMGCQSSFEMSMLRHVVIVSDCVISSARSTVVHCLNVSYSSSFSSFHSSTKYLRKCSVPGQLSHLCIIHTYPLDYILSFELIFYMFSPILKHQP